MLPDPRNWSGEGGADTESVQVDKRKTHSAEFERRSVRTLRSSCVNHDVSKCMDSR